MAMKQKAERIIALDYFRGICILVVILSHSSAFSLPVGYLSGVGRLWTSAAEFFLLLSGLTLGIVRGSKIGSDFKAITLKMWRRAGGIYLLNVLMVSLSLLIALFVLSHGLTNDVVGNLPTNSGRHLFWSILNLSYGIGWASFLACYAVYMIFAPFALYTLKTRYWYIVPFISIVIFVLNFSHEAWFGYASNLAVWQLYFVMGMVLARFRLGILACIYNLKEETRKSICRVALTISVVAFALSVLLNFNIVARLAMTARLPTALKDAYMYLLHHRSVFDILFMSNRTGVLRPIVTLLFLATAYLVYQNNKAFLLKYTGKFVNSLGRETLWVFVAQAIAIPLLAALPVARSLPMNLLLTSWLIGLMWLVARRRVMVARSINYYAKIREAVARRYTLAYETETE
jgi:hypothetical protein